MRGRGASVRGAGGYAWLPARNADACLSCVDALGRRAVSRPQGRCTAASAPRSQTPRDPPIARPSLCTSRPSRCGVSGSYVLVMLGTGSRGGGPWVAGPLGLPNSTKTKDWKEVVYTARLLFCGARGFQPAGRSRWPKSSLQRNWNWPLRGRTRQSHSHAP